MAASSYVVEDVSGFRPDGIFTPGRDQVVVAVRITPTFGAIDLDVLATVVDAGNERGFALVREQVFKDEYLVVTFDAYEGDDDDAAD